ncbi:hypothetical protein [Rhodococcus sp. NPDC058521]|uniref:hypothetical protein n=1 Tax=Rhodococcus sp. NPDC058521 TaxID=3346536 RepID=UPI003660EA21
MPGSRRVGSLASCGAKPEDACLIDTDIFWFVALSNVIAGRQEDQEVIRFPSHPQILALPATLHQ